jgi:hypothetical protein
MGLGSLDDSMDARNIRKLKRFPTDHPTGKDTPQPEHADKSRLDSGLQQKGQSKKSGVKTPTRMKGGGERTSPQPEEKKVGKAKGLPPPPGARNDPDRDVALAMRPFTPVTPTEVFRKD